MPEVIAMFGSSPGAAREAYEAWPRHVTGFAAYGLGPATRIDGLKTSDLLSGVATPNEFVKTFEHEDCDSFVSFFAAPSIRKIAAAFQTSARDPISLVTGAVVPA